MSRPRSPEEGRSRGPSGCALGFFGVLLILLVGGMVGWFGVLQPYLRSTTRSALRKGIATQVAAIEIAPMLPTGEVWVTEERINAEIDARAGAYAPFNDAAVTITTREIRLSFSLYGVESSFSGRPAARDGRLVVENGDLDGPAARVLSADDAALIIEEPIASLLARSRLRATGAELSDGVVTIHTAPATDASTAGGS